MDKTYQLTIGNQQFNTVNHAHSRGSRVKLLYSDVHKWRAKQNLVTFL